MCQRQKVCVCGFVFPHQSVVAFFLRDTFDRPSLLLFPFYLDAFNMLLLLSSLSVWFNQPNMSDETDINIRFKQHARELFRKVAKDSFGRDQLYESQETVLLSLLQMKEHRDGYYPSSFLYISPTGSGKTLTQDVFGRAFCVVKWTISPLHALSSDQVSRLFNLSSHTNDDGFKAYHLDEMTPCEIKKMQEKLSKLTPESQKCISSFSSPQIIAEKKIVRELYNKLQKKPCGLLSS